MMNPFEMVVAIVAIVYFIKFMRHAIDRKYEWAEHRRNESQANDERIDRLEQRMANLETIVLEREKKREYEKL